MSLIDWPNVLVGALLPFLVGLLLALYNFIRLFNHHPLAKIVGDFDLIHWSGTERTIRRKKLRISRKFGSGFVAHLEPHPSIPLSYNGRVKIGTGQIFNINFSSKEHPGQLNLSFLMPLTSNFSAIKGVFSSTTLNYEPFAGLALIAKTNLPDEDAEVLLGDYRLVRAIKSHLSIERNKNAVETVENSS